MVRWRALKPSQTFKRDCNPQILMVIMPLLFWVRLVISFASSFGPRALAMFQKSLPPRPSILRKSGRANEKKATEGYKQKKKKKKKKRKKRERKRTEKRKRKIYLANFMTDFMEFHRGWLWVIVSDCCIWNVSSKFEFVAPIMPVQLCPTVYCRSY